MKTNKQTRQIRHEVVMKFKLGEAKKQYLMPFYGAFCNPSKGKSMASNENKKTRLYLFMI